MLTTGADTWGAAHVSPSWFWFLSKYEDTQGFTRDVGWEWTEGPTHRVGELISWDLVEPLASPGELNMAVCMRRISPSWSPDTFALLDSRLCFFPFWGDNESRFTVSDSETGIIGGSAERDAVRVLVGDTESSMTSFSSSESPRKGRFSSLCWPESELIWSGFGVMVWFATGWVVSSFMGLVTSADEEFISSCEPLPVFTRCSLDFFVLSKDGEPGAFKLLTRAFFSFCILGGLMGAASPNVSRSLRSISKSRPLFPEDTMFLSECLWFRNRNKIIVQVKKKTKDMTPHIWNQCVRLHTGGSCWSSSGSSVNKWNTFLLPSFLKDSFRLSSW